MPFGSGTRSALVLCLLFVCACGQESVQRGTDIAGAPSSREQGIAEIRRLHAQVLQAHLNGDVDAWMAVESDTVISANGGRVTFPAAVERRSGRTPYLENARFQRYRDIREPIVRISDDGGLGWLIAEVEVVGSYRNPDWTTEDINTAWAWIELYERTDQGWEMVGNVSNSRALE